MTDLDKAYALSGPEDCARLYANWAATYDQGFAQSNDYRLPAQVAAAFIGHGGAGPVLDVGAGTGLLAEALRAMGADHDIDGCDLSPEMLAKAGAKDLYTNLCQADITAPFHCPRKYLGIVSSGTFTHGHVGPEAIAHLTRHALPGALFALSINAGVYVEQGFDRVLAAHPGLILQEVSIYGPAASDPAHAADRALIAIWRQPEAT